MLLANGTLRRKKLPVATDCQNPGPWCGAAIPNQSIVVRDPAAYRRWSSRTSQPLAEVAWAYQACSSPDVDT